MTIPLILPLILIGIAFILAAALPVLTSRSRAVGDGLGQNRMMSRAEPTIPTRWFVLLAAFPAAAFACLVWLESQVVTGEPLAIGMGWLPAWLPALSMRLSLYLDSLSALFALLITGIGTLVTIYTPFYLRGDPGAPRFLTYLFLFMAAMLGLVMAGDVITLFIFWEGTSLTSFLLIGFKYKDEAVRKSAFKALFITGGGGIALLAGLLWVSSLAGGTDYATILHRGDVLRNNPFYPAFLGLLLLGAFTKSAQAPAHIWLPEAMSAPTPASAYLHSATMVKAGVYLLARLNPALGFTDLWFWVLSGVGILTMLVGAFLGFKQRDLKALLAYSTISQLGVLVALIGQDTEIAFKALVISTLAHALYKSALFMVVGIVDHEAGRRDLERLGGLRHAMPFTYTVALGAALSMAGLPPLFGFLAKETLLATATHPSLPHAVDIIFPLATVIAGALILGQAGLLVYETFLGHPKENASEDWKESAKEDSKEGAKGGFRATKAVHDPAAGMWLMPAIPAAISLLIGLLPEPKFLAAFLAKAATAAYGAEVKVSLALWTGINVPLVLSLIAVSTGLALFSVRHWLRPRLQSLWPGVNLDRFYSFVLRGIDSLAALGTRLQAGYLRFYLSMMLVALLVLVVLYGELPLAGLTAGMAAPWVGPDQLDVLRVFILGLAAFSTLVSVFLQRDFYAILALSVSGLAVAGWIALEPAPDVALVQIIVDFLATLILVLSLTRLPRRQRQRTQDPAPLQKHASLVREGILVSLAAGVGLVVTVLVYSSLSTRPHTSLVTPYYAANAKLLTGAKDIVGAILVDFRGFDTLFEIVVFACAGLGIHTLLHYAARKAGDREPADPAPPAADLHPTTGVTGLPTSPLLHLLAYALLPLAMLQAVIQMFYGHDQPGDGFTAGVFISLAIGFWYVVFGYQTVKKQLPWVRSGYLIGAGLVLALVNGFLGSVIVGDRRPGVGFLAPVDYGNLLNLPLPSGFNLSNSFFFEVAICLTVLGGATYILDNLGRPKELDVESDTLLIGLQKEQERDS